MKTQDIMCIRFRKGHCYVIVFFSLTFLLLYYLPLLLYVPMNIQYLPPTPYAYKDKFQKIDFVQTWKNSVTRKIRYLPGFEKKLRATVPGWGRSVSRNISLYVMPNNITTLINVKKNSLDLFLLVVVCSAVKNLEQRRAIRDTWATLADKSTYVVFLLGKTNNSTLQNMIMEESEVYNDVIQEDFKDTYNNLTIKSVMMLKWALKNSFAKFLMKVDDDIYLNLPALVKTLKPVVRRRNLLVGWLYCKTKPIRDPKDKWFTPRYIFRGSVFPNYLSGSGYFMSWDVVNRLYQAALTTPVVHLEDVYITGVCALAAHVKPLYLYGIFYTKQDLSDSCNPAVLTNHRLSPDDLRKAFSYISHCTPVPPDPRSKRLAFIPQCKYRI